MLRNTTQLSFLMVLVTFGLVFTSCKDDDEPAPKSQISFSPTAMRVSEGDGNIEVSFELSKPAPRDFTLSYDLTGTAIEGTTAAADYDIQGTYGKVDVTKGETSGVIKIAIIQDDKIEGDETIIITMDRTDDNGVEIGDDDEIKITIEDDDNGQSYTVSFAVDELTKTESDGLIEIEVSVNPVPTQNLTIKYEIGEGTMAIDSLLGFNEKLPRRYWDYHIDGVSGELVIPSGETSGKIKIMLYTDFEFEYYEHGSYETIELNLLESPGIKIGARETIAINVEQQDGRIVDLIWNEDTDVDMDMFLWLGNDLASMGLFSMSVNIGSETPIETLFIPSILNNATVGLSYTYYSGSENPLNFISVFTDYENGEWEGEETADIFSGQYTDANKNEWDTEQGTDPIIVQSLKLVDGAFVDLTDITIPASGSRAKSYEIPSWVKKETTRFKTLSNSFRYRK